MTDFDRKLEGLESAAGGALEPWQRWLLGVYILCDGKTQEPVLLEDLAREMHCTSSAPEFRSSIGQLQQRRDTLCVEDFMVLTPEGSDEVHGLIHSA